MTKIRVGAKVLVRPSILEDHQPIDLKTVFVVRRPSPCEHWWAVEGFRTEEEHLGHFPIRLHLREDDMIAYEPPPEKAAAPLDPLTDLSAAEEDSVYAQRRDAHLAGETPLPCLGLHPATEVIETPFGPITLQLVEAHEGAMLSALPADVALKLEWLHTHRASLDDAVAARRRFAKPTPSWEFTDEEKRKYLDRLTSLDGAKPVTFLSVDKAAGDELDKIALDYGIKRRLAR